MFRIGSMCDYRRHVSYIIIKDTRGSFIMYSKPRLSRIQVDWGILSELRENPT